MELLEFRKRTDSPESCDEWYELICRSPKRIWPALVQSLLPGCGERGSDLEVKAVSGLPLRYCRMLRFEKHGSWKSSEFLKKLTDAELACAWTATPSVNQNATRNDKRILHALSMQGFE